MVAMNPPMASTALSPSRLQRRWRTADGGERRRLIVDTALNLLGRHGLERVTMRRVAERLGIGAMTLYTYVNGQHGLHQQMTRRGFEMLRDACQHASTLGTSLKWRGGARAYIQFAADHPNLYKLMFDVQPNSHSDDDILRGGFQPLIDRVLWQMADNGLSGDELDRRAHEAAARFWFALHGLTSLLIAGRTDFLERDIDDLLDDLLAHVAPT